MDQKFRLFLRCQELIDRWVPTLAVIRHSILEAVLPALYDGDFRRMLQKCPERPRAGRFSRDRVVKA
jgi:hypothetical protein